MSPVTQKVLFTALPRGRYPDGDLHLVAFVSPQLSTDDGSDATIAQFPDFVRWPSVPITWAVSIDGTVITSGIQVVSQPAARSELWDALFPPTTLVRSFVPADLTSRRVLSYPVAEIVSLVRAAYRNLLLDAGSAVELPAVQDLIDVIGPASFFGRDGAGRREALEAELDAELATHRINRPGDPADPDTASKAILQHQRFLAPRRDTFGPQPEPVRDFHEYAAMLGHYRELVRLLGLAVDLKVPSAGIPLPPSPVLVQVQPSWTSALNPGGDIMPRSTDVRSYTRTVLNASTFLAAPRASRPRVFGGRLSLVDQQRYRLVEVDQDGAAVKVRQLAENLQRGLSMSTLDTPDRQALPALRSGGIAVAETGAHGIPNKPPMAGELVAQIDKGAALTATLNPPVGPIDENQLVLDAEDLTIGFRFDVWDSLTTRWHSLTARTGEFNFFGANISVPSSDQAILQPAPTSTTDPAAVDPDMFVQQTLFNWTGWSLGGHLPGFTIPVDATPENPIGPPPVPLPDDFQLAFEFTPTPGSLPRLRFGATYYVRGRSADLAGDSVAFGGLNSQPGTPAFDQWFPAGPVTYRRFEPVQTPPLLFGTANTMGESIENVVLRSNYDADPGDVIAGHPTRQAAARYVTPPKVAVRMIEQHGLLDRDADPPVDRELYRLLADRDPVMLPVSDPDPVTGEFVVNYLPDPLARGVAFVGLPGVTGPPYRVAFDIPGHEWPNPRPFRIVMRQGVGPPQEVVDANGLSLIVFVPKAVVARVKVSAIIHETDLELMGLWGWLKNPLPGEPAPPVDDGPLLDAAVSGQIWLFTPWRALTFVHAVRQPLVAPRFANDFQWKRQFDDTYVTIKGLIRFDRLSTGAVDVHASWPNPVDAGPEGPPPTLPGDVPPTAGNKTPIPLRKQGNKNDPDYVPVNKHHELGDTKHKVITYQVEATTKFTEYFTQRTTTAVGGNPIVVRYGVERAVRFSGNPVVAGSVSVRSANGSNSWPGTGDHPAWSVDLGAGKIWFNEDSEPPIPLRTPVEVTFLDTPVSRRGPTVVRNIRASARPRAPKIDRVVPTFEWTETRSPVQVVSRRPTAMLRVYLQRPWWTSGAGEKLALVLLPGGVDGSEIAVPEHYLPFVTQWGRDPIYGTDALPDPLPRFTSFPEATSALRGLFLDELPHVAGSEDQLVDVSAHDVAFDATQDLWYSDISIDAGSTYQPFVRLALARFQPDALAGPTDDRYLSRVVLADIMQLAPERTATVVYDSDTEVTVTLHGPTYDSNDLGGASGSATIQLEKRRTRVPDPDVGWLPIQGLKAMTYKAPVGQARFWTRKITLPGPIVPGLYRLVIEQSDLFQHDSGTGTGFAIGNRLVHTDIINL